MAGTQQNDSPNKPLPALLLKWAPAIVLIITAALYSKAIFADFTSFDDEIFILKNPLVQDSSLKGIQNIFTTFSAGKYQPFTTLSFALEYRFFGFNPLVFHLDNVILHLLSTFFVFKIAERLSGSRTAAATVALLFGIHPMHVEEVAWASERKDMLYAFFYLFATYVYLRFLDSGYHTKYYIIVFLLFLFSLFSKTEATTLPLILLLIDWYKGRKITGKVIAEKLPLLACSVLVTALGFMAHGADGAVAALTAASYGFINRIFLFTTVPAFYIIKLVFPFSLSAMHYYPDLHNGQMPWAYYASLPFLAFIIWLVLRPGSFRREMIFGALFFLITISVMPQIAGDGPSLTPERYCYIPYIGFFYIIAMWLTTIAIPKWKMPATAIFTFFIAICGILTWLRIDEWKNSYVIYTDILKKNADIADCSYFYWLRANDKIANHDMPGAIEDYTTAITQHPNYTEAYANRGTASFQAGDINGAVDDFDKAIRLSPNHARYYYNRASAKASVEDFTGALTDYNAFLKLSPDDNTAYTDRGMVRLSLKDSSGACEDWKKATSLGNETAPQLMQQFCY